MRLLLFWIFLGEVAAADLHVAYFDTQAVEDTTVVAAADTLSRILEFARVPLRWQASVPDAALFVSYVQPAQGSKGLEQKCRALRSIQLRILPAGPPKLSKSVLGYSSPLASEGINVTIFANAVKAASDSYGVPVSVVLGHAIAHEIGHVLMRSGSHSVEGLMSASWNAREYWGMNVNRLRFSKSEAEILRRTVAGEGCEAAAENYAGFVERIE